jgi:nucleotide-binding universal stress UspA family protein
MIPFRRVLVPVDFSEPSRRALDYGLALAIRFQANLSVAHIIPEGAGLTIETNPVENAVKAIQSLIPEKWAKAVNLEPIAKVGHVEDELLKIVQEQSIDIIVMGSHGSRLFRRWFLGSVAEHILRKVPVPILTVSHAEEGGYTRATDVISLKRVLYATDLGDSSAVGMKYAVGLSQKFGAELTVISVVEYLNLSYEAIAYLGNEREERMQKRQIDLEAFIAREAPKGMPVKPLVVDGKAHQQILSKAEELHVDCIILNLQSTSPLERALLGSTAEKVVRSSTIPILSIPS